MNDDLELGLGWFSAECQLVEMRISTVKSELMVLSKKKVECSLWVGRNDLLLPVKFKHLWDFFTSEGKVKRKADRLVQHLYSLQRSTGLLWWIEEGLKSKLFISPPASKPRVLSKRIWSQIWVLEMSFLQRISGSQSWAAAAPHWQEPVEVVQTTRISSSWVMQVMPWGIPLGWPVVCLFQVFYIRVKMTQIYFTK